MDDKKKVPYKDLLFLQERMGRIFDEALTKYSGVPPRITAPNATMPSNRREAATLSTATGISNAPGTRMISMSASAAPCLRRQCTDALSSESTMKSLNRAAMIAKRASRTIRSPSVVFILSMECGYSSTYPVISRSKPDIASMCLGADNTRILVSPRSRRICAQTP